MDGVARTELTKVPGSRHEDGRARAPGERHHHLEDHRTREDVLIAEDEELWLRRAHEAHRLREEEDRGDEPKDIRDGRVTTNAVERVDGTAPDGPACRHAGDPSISPERLFHPAADGDDVTRLAEAGRTRDGPHAAATTRLSGTTKVEGDCEDILLAQRV